MKADRKIEINEISQIPHDLPNKLTTIIESKAEGDASVIINAQHGLKKSAS